MALQRNNVEELIFYRYALLIADAVVNARHGSEAVSRTGGRYWRYANATFQRLKRHEIAPSRILRENKLLVTEPEACAYCGATTRLEWDHIVPRAHGGPDTIDNLVRACATCNRSKGDRDPITWYGDNYRDVPRLVMGKFLKLVHAEHAARGTLGCRHCPGTTELKTAGLAKVFAEAGKTPTDPTHGEGANTP